MAESIYDRASAIIAKRKKQREEKLSRRRAEVFGKIPRIAEIEAELDRYGMRMLNMVASGENDPERAVAAISAENRAYVEECRRLLAVHGYSEDYLEIPPVCAKCNDTGYVENKICGCLKEEILSCALESANLSQSSAKKTFENFSLDYYSDEYAEEYGCSPRENMQAILKECKSFVQGFPNNAENLLLCGGCGLGKTHLSSAVAHELLLRGVDVLYVSSNSLFPMLEDIHFGRDVSERADYIVRKINDCDLLILDDLGSEFVTQFTISELFGIINTRIMNDKKMIISTNLNSARLAEVYTGRIASRIYGSFAILEFLGDDIRKIKKFEGRL